MKLRVKQFIDDFLGGLLVIFNLCIARPLGLLLHRNHKLTQSPDHIIVIKILGLGSLLLASDALESLKRRYPNAQLILICGRGVAPGIAPAGLFHKIWTLDDASFFSLFRSSVSILTNSWRLKNRWVVDLEVYSKLTTIFSLWTMALNRFGFQLSKVHFRNYLNTHNCYFNQFCNVQDNYHSLVRLMGVTEFAEFRFPFLATTGRTGEITKKYISINNTCSELGGYLRKIPPVTLRDVCINIIEKTPYHIAFTGAPADFKDNEEFINQYLPQHKERINNIAGKFSFNEYYHFLHDECVMMLTIDSAPLFIAWKAGLPTVSVWGPTNPTHRLSKETMQSGRHPVHYLSVECSPCLHHTRVLPCGGNNFCMKNMEAASIFIQVQSVILRLQNELAIA